MCFSPDDLFPTRRCFQKANSVEEILRNLQEESGSDKAAAAAWAQGVLSVSRTMYNAERYDMKYFHVQTFY